MVSAITDPVIACSDSHTILARCTACAHARISHYARRSQRSPAHPQTWAKGATPS
jgi:hypothetical protein